MPTLKIALVAEPTLKIPSLLNHTPVDWMGFPSLWVKTAFSTPFISFISSKCPFIAFLKSMYDHLSITKNLFKRNLLNYEKTLTFGKKLETSLISPFQS